MKKGFTLIEIMVVVSIITMLSSVFFATITPVRAKARDTVRVQQVRQIDLAIQLYKTNHNGAAPPLVSCAAQATAMQYSDAVSGCLAISSQGAGNAAWGRLANDLAPYISTLPKDPCGLNCLDPNGNVLGYTYYSPAYLQSVCGLVCSGQSTSQLDQNYQVSSQLETQGSQNSQTWGTNGSAISLTFTNIGGGYFRLTWYATNTYGTNPCSLKALDVNNIDIWPPVSSPVSSSGSIDREYLAPFIKFILVCSTSDGLSMKSLTVQ